MEKSKLKENIAKIAGTTVITLSDIILYTIYLTLSTSGTSGGKGIYKTFSKADKLFEEINTRTIIDTLSKLKQRRNYILLKEEKNSKYFEITKLGRERLNEIIPHYKVERLWDGSIYLISYDIPEKKRKVRNLLRFSLKKIGAGLLQSSLWLSPYNPTGVVKELAKHLEIEEFVIVSKIDNDSSLIKEKMAVLIERVYKLKDVNKQYDYFLNQINKITSLLKLSFLYNSVLSKDPQLPFRLEPTWFLANKAYSVYRKRLTEILNK
ncbi:hypothetical protein HYT02_00040 [Candidatus Gottesmanbacteria bacterium]|nr:hypothetical protein [Candidatus Gottesmanbacteria bacterium]